MSEDRRCYIHVGLPKTGTSYLQSIFRRSTEALSEQGLQMLPASAQDTFEMMLALRGVLKPGIDPPEAFEALDRFREEASAASAPRALVTQELLGAAGPHQIATLLSALEHFETHLVVTVRDLATFAPSAWQQHVKARGTKPFEEYLDDLSGREGAAPQPSYDVNGVLDRWTPHFPAERVHVVVVPRRETPQRVLLDRYCQVVGVDPDRLDTSEPTSNTSLGMVQAELLRRVNVALGDRLPHLRAGYREQGKGFLAGKILHPQQGRPARTPRHLADWCAEFSEALVSRLEEGGYDVVGDLDELLPDESAFADGPQHVSDAEVAAAAAEALASILDERATEKKKLARLRSRLRSQEQRIEELSAAPQTRSRLVPRRWVGRTRPQV
jgi:hypothetical protein